jgi:hypothetical protein
VHLGLDEAGRFFSTKIGPDRRVRCVALGRLVCYSVVFGGLSSAERFVRRRQNNIECPMAASSDKLASPCRAGFLRHVSWSRRYDIRSIF